MSNLNLNFTRVNFKLTQFDFHTQHIYAFSVINTRKFCHVKKIYACDTLTFIGWLMNKFSVRYKKLCKHKSFAK